MRSEKKGDFVKNEITPIFIGFNTIKMIVNFTEVDKFDIQNVARYNV